MMQIILSLNFYSVISKEYLQKYYLILFFYFDKKSVFYFFYLIIEFNLFIFIFNI